MNNTNFTLDNVYEMPYVDFMTFRNVRIARLKEEAKERESKEKLPSFNMPNVSVPSFNVPNLPKY